MSIEEKIIQISGMGGDETYQLYGLSQTGQLYILHSDYSVKDSDEEWRLVTKGPKPIEPVI